MMAAAAPKPPAIPQEMAVITLVCGMQYIPYLFIAVAAAFVGLMLRVVKNVMENAVELKAENELTI